MLIWYVTSSNRTFLFIKIQLNLVLLELGLVSSSLQSSNWQYTEYTTRFTNLQLP